MSETNEQRGKFDTGYPHSLRPELHKALIARGIEYWFAQGMTFWNCDDGRECVAYGYNAGGEPRLAVKIVGIKNHEQVIASTLGAGTCNNVHEPPKDTTFWPVPHFKCSECGATHVSMEYVYFCPNCGAKVEDE